MAASSKDTSSMVAVIPKFLNALPSVFKNMPSSLLLVLQYFAGILSIIYCAVYSHLFLSLGKVPSTFEKEVCMFFYQYFFNFTRQLYIQDYGYSIFIRTSIQWSVIS